MLTGSSQAPRNPRSAGAFTSAEGGLAIKEQMYAAQSCESTSRVWCVGIDDGAGQYFVFQPACKMWSCPACSIWKTKQWVKRTVCGAQELADAGHGLRFITFTSHRAVRSTLAGLKIWRAAWPRVRASIHRCSRDVHYMWVMERSQTGRFHVHAIMTDFEHGWRWNDVCARSGLGWNVDDKEVKSTLATGKYVSKYLYKQLADARWPKGARRVNTSRQWPKLPETNYLGDNMYVIAKSFAELSVRLQALQSIGYTARRERVVVQ